MEHKKEVMAKGISLHVLVYIVLGIILNALGIPGMVIFLIILTLFWGLVILGYAYWFHK